MLEKWEIKTEKSDLVQKVLKNIAASLKIKLRERIISEDEVLGLSIRLPGAKDRAGFFDCLNLGWTHVAAEKESKRLKRWRSVNWQISYYTNYIIV